MTRPEKARIVRMSAKTSMAVFDDLRVTREESSQLLNLSVAEIRRKEKLGVFIRVARGKHGETYYAREAILQYAARHGIVADAKAEAYAPFSAEEAKLVCAELRNGASMLDCLEKLTVHPAKIRAIVHEYEKMSGAILLDVDTVNSINELPLDGTFPVTKASDILALLTVSASGAPCAVCTKRPRHLCKTCAIPFVRKQLQKEHEKNARPVTADDADET